MDCRTGNIYERNSEKEMESLQAKFHQETERELVRLEHSDVKTLKEMSFDKRRGWMRNKLCPVVVRLNLSGVAGQLTHRQNDQPTGPHSAGINSRLRPARCGLFLWAMMLQ